MNLFLSRAVAKRIGARQNCCYRNAMLALLTIPELATFCYVEGWIITVDWPIEHGWLMGPTGEIIDPTLALFGQRFHSARYFPGAEFRYIDVDYYYSAEQLACVGHVTCPIGLALHCLCMMQQRPLPMLADEVSSAEKRY